MAHLLEMPLKGKVMIGAPAMHPTIARLADRQGLDYFLSPLVPNDSAYVMDIDAIMDFDVSDWQF